MYTTENVAIKRVEVYDTIQHENTSASPNTTFCHRDTW